MIRLFLRRLRYWLLWPLVVLSTVLFCIVFTIPGNQLIAWSANQVVSGLNIRLGEARFYDDKPFSVTYEQGETTFILENISLNLNWYCRGICIDSLRINKLFVVLPETPSESNDDIATAITTIVFGEKDSVMTLPLRFLLTQVAISSFEMHLGTHQQVHASELVLSAQGDKSQIILQTLHAQSIAIHDNRPVPIKPQVVKSTLPALPKLEIYSPLNVVVDDLFVKQISLTQQQNSHVIEDVKFKGFVDGSELNLQHFSAQSFGAVLELEAQAKLAQLNSLALTSSVRYQNEHVKLVLNGPLNALKITLTNQGDYAADLQGVVDLWRENLPFNFNAQLQAWQFAKEVDTVTLHSLGFDLTGDANNYVLALQANSQLNALSAVQSQLRAAGNLNQITITDASLTSAKSEVQFSSTINWANALKVDANALVKQLDISEVSTQYRSNLNGSIALSLAQQGQRWKVTLPALQLQGDINDIPLTLSSQLSLDTELNGVIKNLQLQSGENFVKLAGKFNKNWDLSGQLNLSHAAQISPSLRGLASGDFNIKGKRNAPIAKWQLAINGLALPQIEIDHITSVGELNVANNFEADISLKAANIRLFDKSLRSLDFNVNGNKLNQKAALQLDSDWVSSNFTLVSSLVGDNWNAVINDLFVSDNVKRFSVDKPLDVALNWRKQALSLAAHCWRSQYSKVCIDRFAVDTQNGDVGLTLAEFNLRSIDHHLPPELVAKGIFTGAIDLQWKNQVLSRLVAQLTSTEFALTLHQAGQQFSLPFEQSEININANASTAQFELSLASQLLGQLTSNLQVHDLTNQRELTGNVSLTETQLANFKPFLKQFEQLSGAVKANVDISGTLSAPKLTGQIEAARVALAGAQLPIALTDSDLALVFDQQQALLQGNLKDRSGGFADIHGLINWQNTDLLASLDIKGEQIGLKPQTGVNVKLSPNLKLSYEDKRLNVAGQIVLPYGRIKMKSLPSTAVQVSDDEVIVDASIPTKKSLPFNYLMNVKLVVKDDVIIDSFGLYSKVAGQLTLKKAQNSPLLVVGDMNLLEGNYQAFSQDLHIKTGQIGFNGAIDKPYLNIRAIRNPATTADGVIAGIKLTGPLETPQLEIYSEPSMDQAMTLSYLLNGRPIGDGDTSNDGLLTQMLITQGVERSQGVINKIGKAIGVRDIALASKGSGDETKVEISGYVMPGVQVRYSIGIFDPITEIAVRYQILPRLYIEATSGLNNALDILYKFDWD